MLQARFSNGAFFIGLDAENIRRLTSGAPIMLDLRPLGGEDLLVIGYGPTFDALRRDLEAATGRPLPAATPQPTHDGIGPTAEQPDAQPLSAAMLDTLKALVNAGPLWDGDVPSKSGRDELIAKGLAVRVIVKGADGFTAATYAGRDLFKALRPGPDGQADTIKEAQVNETAMRAIEAARKA